MIKVFFSSRSSINILRIFYFSLYVSLDSYSFSVGKKWLPPIYSNGEKNDKQMDEWMDWVKQTMKPIDEKNDDDDHNKNISFFFSFNKFHLEKKKAVENWIRFGMKNKKKREILKLETNKKTKLFANNSIYSGFTHLFYCKQTNFKIFEIEIFCFCFFGSHFSHHYSMLNDYYYQPHQHHCIDTNIAPLLIL